MRDFLVTRNAALTILTTLLLSAAAMAQEVWVITVAEQSVYGAHQPSRVIELDAAQRIEAEFSAGLPNDPQRAAMVIQQRLRQGGSPLQQRMQEAYQGLTDAWSLGITATPAVVVDQLYVVYGEPDLDLALERIAQHRKEQP